MSNSTLDGLAFALSVAFVLVIGAFIGLALNEIFTEDLPDNCSLQKARPIVIEDTRRVQVVPQYIVTCEPTYQWGD